MVFGMEFLKRGNIGIIIGAISLIIIIGLMIFFSINKHEPSFLLSLQINDTHPVISQNQPLLFDLIIQSEKSSDVEINYEILKIPSNDRVRNNEKIIEISNKEATIIEESIAVQNLDYGGYKFKINITAGKIKKTTSFLFSVREQPEIQEKSKNEPKEQIKQQDNFLQNTSTDFSPTITEIIEISYEDQEKAQELCKKNNNQDNCFHTLAQEINDSDLCLNINLIEKKDSCFTDIAFKTNSNICDKIYNQYRKNTCKAIFQSQ